MVEKKREKEKNRRVGNIKERTRKIEEEKVKVEKEIEKERNTEIV